MREELDEKLCREFPNLYRQRHKDGYQTAMCWGFQCGDGWYKIIHDLSKELELEIIKYKAKYGEEAAESLCASTVKEKFGSLRFYLHSGTDRMHWIIDLYEPLTYRTCEDCGSDKAIHSSDGWVRTMCLDHWSMHFAERTVDAVYYDSKIGTKTKTYGEKKGESYPAVVLEDRDGLVQRAYAQQNLLVALDRGTRWTLFPKWYRNSERKGLAGYIENKYKSALSALSYLKYGWWYKQRPARIKRWFKFQLFMLERRLTGKFLG